MLYHVSAYAEYSLYTENCKLFISWAAGVPTASLFRPRHPPAPVARAYRGRKQPAASAAWQALSFSATLQAVATSAGFATARWTECQAGAAGRTMWGRWLRVCQVLCGRDARAPGGHHPMACFSFESPDAAKYAPQRISLRHSAWLLRLPIKGGVISWDKPHSSFTQAAGGGGVRGWLTTGDRRRCAKWGCDGLRGGRVCQEPEKGSRIGKAHGLRGNLDTSPKRSAKNQALPAMRDRLVVLPGKPSSRRIARAATR